MGDSRGSGQMQRHRRQSQDINANKHAASLPLCSLCSTVPLKSIKGWTFPFLTVYTLDIPIGRGLIDRSDTMFAYQIPYMGAHAGEGQGISSPLGVESLWGRAGGYIRGLTLYPGY